MKNHNHCGHKILIVADCKFYVSEVHYQKKKLSEVCDHFVIDQ